MGSVTDFALNDTVAWDRDRYPAHLASMIERFGEGPFRVVGLSIIPGPGDPRSHPLQVTIELPDKTRHALAGDWFKKAV